MQLMYKIAQIATRNEAKLLRNILAACGHVTTQTAVKSVVQLHTRSEQQIIPEENLSIYIKDFQEFQPGAGHTGRMFCPIKADIFSTSISFTNNI